MAPLVCPVLELVHPTEVGQQAVETVRVVSSGADVFQDARVIDSCVRVYYDVYIRMLLEPKKSTLHFYGG